MAKTGFNKATEKMFKGFGNPVKIAQSDGGERLSSEERDQLEKEMEEADRQREEEVRDDERRRTIKELVDMKVVQPAEGASVDGPEVKEEQKAQRGRPLKDPDVTKYVLLNFRVSVEFRQKLKVMAAQQGCPIVELFNEAFDLLFKKYGVE